MSSKRPHRSCPPRRRPVLRLPLLALLARYCREGEAVFEPRSRRPVSNPDDEVSLVAVDEVGLPLSPDNYSDRFAALCKAAGARQIVVHSVRHTVARIMHESGVAPACAAAFLGHTLAVHLSVYVVATQLGSQAAGQALGAALA